MKKYPRRCTALVTALCLLVFSISGCVNTRVVHQPSLDSGTSVSLAVYLEEKHRRAGGPTVDGVITELHYLDDGQRQLLRREASGNWRMDGLVPGKYEAEVRYRVADSGEWEELSGDTRESFTLREGENADIDIVLEKTPVAVVVVAGLAAAVLAVLLIDAIDDSVLGLDDLLIPPPEMVWLGTEVMLAGSGEYRVPASAEDQQPVSDSSLHVVDHLPRHLSTGVELGEDVRFRLNTVIDPDSLDPRDLLLVDRLGRSVTGGVYCLDDSKTCVFNPLRPLRPGQTYTVTLRGEGLATPDGRKLIEDYWWYFTTAFDDSTSSVS